MKVILGLVGLIVGCEAASSTGRVLGGKTRQASLSALGPDAVLARSDAAASAAGTEIVSPTVAVNSLPAWRGGTSPWRGVVSVAGGFIAHIVLGTLYCWGSFQSYVPSSLLFWDGLGKEAHPGQTPDCIRVMPVTIVFQVMGIKLGAGWIKMFGPRVTSVIGCSLIALGVFLSSFMNRLLPFMLFYSVIVGLGIGFLPPSSQTWCLQLTTTLIL